MSRHSQQQQLPQVQFQSGLDNVFLEITCCQERTRFTPFVLLNRIPSQSAGLLVSDFHNKLRVFPINKVWEPCVSLEDLETVFSHAEIDAWLGTMAACDIRPQSKNATSLTAENDSSSHSYYSARSLTGYERSQLPGDLTTTLQEERTRHIMRIGMYKKQPCVRFRLGKCPFGDKCTYLHDYSAAVGRTTSPSARVDDNKSIQSPETPTRVCRFYNQPEGCNRGRNCPFKHFNNRGQTNDSWSTYSGNNSDWQSIVGDSVNPRSFSRSQSANEAEWNKKWIRPLKSPGRDQTEISHSRSASDVSDATTNITVPSPGPISEPIVPTETIREVIPKGTIPAEHTMTAFVQHLDSQPDTSQTTQSNVAIDGRSAADSQAGAAGDLKKDINAEQELGESTSEKHSFNLKSRWAKVEGMEDEKTLELTKTTNALCMSEEPLIDFNDPMAIED